MTILKRTNYFYPATMLDKLAEEKQRTGVPMAEIIRRVMTAYFEGGSSAGMLQVAKIKNGAFEWLPDVTVPDNARVYVDA